MGRSKSWLIWQLMRSFFCVGSQIVCWRPVWWGKAGRRGQAGFVQYLLGELQ